MEMKKAYEWVIDNFSSKENVITSSPFSSGGCKWRVSVFPRGIVGRDDLCLFISNADRQPLRSGWKRRAAFCFRLSNQSGKELYKSNRPPGENHFMLFCAQAPCWGDVTNLTITTLVQQGYLDNNKLYIQLFTNVVEVVHHGISTENDILDLYGFHLFASQLFPLIHIFEQHRGFANEFKQKNPRVVHATYMNILIALIHTLNTSPQNLSVTQITNAQSQLTDLTHAGFKLDWLNSKLQQILLDRKNALSDHGSWLQKLEKRVKTMEFTLSDLESNIKYSDAAKVSSLEFIDNLIKRFFLSCFFAISKH